MDTYWIFCSLVLFWTTKLKPVDGTECISPEDCLHQDLFKKYNAHTRPRKNPAEILDVTLSLDLNSLAGIDEKNEVMNLVAIFHTTWTDDFLAWNTSDYNGTSLIMVPADLVWLPKLAIINSADKFFQKSHREDFYAIIFSNGLVYWPYGGTVSTTCSLDISKFPYDSQSCSLQIYSWGYTTDYVTVKPGGDIDVSTFPENALWDIVNTSVELLAMPSGDQVFAGIEFTLHWQRKTLYHVFNMMLPIMLLLVVSMGIFWLPPESGERISLAITVLLSYAVFLIVIMDNTPTNSESLPLISKVVMVIMVSTTIILLESLCIVTISHLDKRPPEWLRQIASGCLARLFCLKQEIPDIADSTIEQKSKTGIRCQSQVMDIETTTTDDNKTKASELKEETELLKIMRAMLKIKQDRILLELFTDEWKVIGKLLDRVMFVITLVGTFTATSLVFWA